MSRRRAIHNAKYWGLLLEDRNGLKQWNEIKAKRAKAARRPMATARV